VAFSVGTAGSAFRRYVTKLSAFVGPAYNSSTYSLDYSKIVFSNNGLDWAYGVPNRPVYMQGRTPSGLYYGYYQHTFLTSTDRNTWTEVGSFAISGYEPFISVNKIVYAENGNYFLALVYNAFDNENYIAYSQDGSSWIRLAGVIADTLEYANYGGSDRFVIASTYFGGGGTFYSSSNGTNWTNLNINAESCILKRVNNKLVAFKNGAAVGNTSTLYEFSPAATNTYTIPTGRYGSIAYGNGTYILLDYYAPPSYDGARITTSTNLSSWTARAIVGGGLPGNPAYGMSWHNVVYGPGQGFILLPNYGDTIIYSSDGITWGKHPLPDYSSIEYQSIAVYSNITHQV
jgi:hypothetical protein